MDALAPYLARVERFASSERMFRRVGRVLVAVSGGQDSLACLAILRELGRAAGFEVVAAHFDHMLRPGSAGDLAFVRETCASLSIPCFTGEGDVRQAASERRMGMEAAAREMRYQFLAFIAGKERADCIATGHTASDQAETVMQRIVRGTGVRGLRGMLPVSPVPGAPAQRLVRPLLELGRADTATICEAAGLIPRVDATNHDLSLGRNRIRIEVLPSLRSLNPSLDHALLGIAASAREAFQPIEREALAVRPRERIAHRSVFALDALRGLPAEALALIVEREAAFHQLPYEVNRTRLRDLASILRAGTGMVAFGEAVIEASCGNVRIGAAPTAPPVIEPKVLNVPGTTMVPGWKIMVSTDPLDAVPGCRSAVVSFADARGALRIRTLRPGDHISLGGAERSVAGWLSGLKVPSWERRGMLAVTDSERVLSVLGATGPQELAPGAGVLHVRAEPAPA